jgi:phage tail sheath protein FI
MPVQLGAPGVYIEEIPSGRRVIRSVSTNIAAFVDFFREGPMNEAVQIFGTSDFARIYGGTDTRSEASFAIPQFFLNGGTEAFVVRVAASDAAGPLATARAVLRAEDDSAAVLTVDAANPGAWGNLLRVSVDHDVIGSTPAGLRFNLSVARHATAAGNAPVTAAEAYLNLSMDPADTRYAPTVINDASALIAVTADPAADGTVRPAATGTSGGDLAAFTAADLDGIGDPASEVTVTIQGQAASVSAVATLAWPNGAVATLAQLRGRLEAAIRTADPTNPSFAGARVTLANGRLRVLSGRSGAAYVPTEIVEVSDTTGTAAATMRLVTGGADAVENVQDYVLGRPNADGQVGRLEPGAAGADVGADGLPPGAIELIGSAAVDPPTGMRALDRVDLFNILCLPRAADLADAEMDAVISNAISYCEERRAFMIVDIPADIDRIDEVKDWLDGNAQYRSTNAAVYFPRVRIPDPTDEFRLRSVGASGTIAGLYARTDTARGVWKARRPASRPCWKG